MKKKWLLPVVFVFAGLLLSAQNEYQYKIDLVNVEKDRVKVSLVPPKMDRDELLFIIPKLVPGSYSIKDYGRFIAKFTAYDVNGKKLKAKQKDHNQFFIYKASKIARIEYFVNDTWDDKDIKNFVFQPGGSNIEAGLNYVINPYCFFGYFDGFKKNPYKIEVTKPAEMYGSTYMTKEVKGPSTDILTATDYVTLADNPIMYCKPDTMSFMIANCKVNISVYSVKKDIDSKKIYDYLNPLATSLKDFLRDLPVSEYHFIYYFDDPERLASSKSKGLTSGYGALEHRHSSFYYLPDFKLEKQVKDLVVSASGHEFLHLVTPLNIHSEEIENFDFLNPKMSQHLWMYEGVTEYFAQLVQFRGGMHTEAEFVKLMREKVNEGEEFGSFSMTEMSKEVVTPLNQKLYLSVYSKGAIMAMLLDIRIAMLTNGQKTLRSVMVELANKYGPSRPFKDDQLFNDIVALTHPDIAKFISSYIVGKEALPYTEFSNLGWNYSAEKTKKVYRSGGLGAMYDSKASAFVFITQGENVLNVQTGDEILAINGNEVTSSNISDLFDQYFRNNESQEKISVKVKRYGIEQTLSGYPKAAMVTTKNYLAPAEGEISGEQKKIHQAIFGM